MEHIPIPRNRRLTATTMKMLCLRYEYGSCRRRFTDGGNRSSFPPAHPPHYSTTMRYVAIRSFLPLVNNTLEPPSPESLENPLESGVPPPDSSPAKPCSSPGPPVIPPVNIPDPKPTSENLASPGGNRRTIGDWFRTVMTKRSHNRTPRQAPSDASPQSGIPSQTKATPPNEKRSTVAPGRRQAVSVPLIQGHGYLTTRFSGRLESRRLDHRFVHASYPL